MNLNSQPRPTSGGLSLGAPLAPVPPEYTTSSPLDDTAASRATEALRVPTALAEAALTVGFVDATATWREPFQLTPAILPDLTR